jgi:hypothetical protein
MGEKNAVCRLNVTGHKFEICSGTGKKLRFSNGRDYTFLAFYEKKITVRRE